MMVFKRFNFQISKTIRIFPYRNGNRDQARQPRCEIYGYIWEDHPFSLPAQPNLFRSFNG